jgi:hypothetical protein
MSDEEITVRRLAGNGVPVNDIAAYLDITKDELLSQYKHIINTAAINRTVAIAENLYDMAVAGNVPASIYWLKSIGKWDEIAKQKDLVEEMPIFEAININLITEVPTTVPTNTKTEEVTPNEKVD